MRATDAHTVLLVKAIEETDSAGALLSEDQRRDASRHARERADWAHDAVKARQPARGSAREQAFVLARAQRLLGDLLVRQPRLALLLQPPGLGLLLGGGLPLAALALGLFAQHVADPHHVNLVFAPALLVLAINLFVYLLLAGRAVLAIARTGKPRPPTSPRLQRLGRWLAPQPMRGSRGLPPLLLNAWLRHQAEWLQLSGPALAARLAALLHTCAAMLALGLIVSLYVGGLFLEYRVGWESTFLGAEEVRALLAALQWPFGWLSGWAPPTVDQVAALRFDATTPPSVAQGAHWVHLYAALLLAFVVLPRLLLAALAHAQRRHRERRVKLDLHAPYFTQLLTAEGLGLSGGRAVQVACLPCSLSPSPALATALPAWAEARFGQGSTLSLLPGADLALPPRQALAPLAAVASQPGQACVLLCSLATTPEPTPHGALLAALQRLDPQARVLLEASAYVERLGAQAGAQRLREREHLWREFCQHHELRCELICLQPVAAGVFDSPLWPAATAPEARP